MRNRCLTTLAAVFSAAVFSAAVVAVACGGQRAQPPKSAPAAAVGSAKSCGAVSWVRGLASAADASIRELAATPDGGVVAVAQLFRKSVVRESGKTLVALTPRGKPDALIVVLRADGRVAWARRIGAENARVEPTAVAVRPDGSILVAGSYAGAPVVEGALEGKGLSLPPIPNAGVTSDHRLFFAWYAADGTPQRAFTSGDAGPSRFVQQVASLGDDIVVLGSFSGALGLGTGSRAVRLEAAGPPKARAQDAFVGVLDAAGEPRWLRRIGSPGSDFPSALGVKKDGSLIIAGSFEKTSGHVANAPSEPLTYGSEPETLSVMAGRRDVFLMEVDRSGRRKWWKAVGGEEGPGLGEGDRVPGIAVTGDGDAVILADLALPAKLGEGGTALAVAGQTVGSFLVRVGGDGQVRWTLPLGAVDARGVTSLPDGDIAVVAHAEGELVYPLGGKKKSTLSISGLEDMLLARHAPDGELRWVTRFGGDGTERGEAVSADPAGALLVGGRLHGDFLIEQDGCPAQAVRRGSHHHPNSFLLRIAPGADASNEPRERRLAELKIKVDRLKKEAAAARQAGDERRACGKLDALTELVPDEPGAWVELGGCRAGLGEREPALAAFHKGIAVGSRHESVIVESHEAARRSAYLGLAALGVSVTMPAVGECGALARAPRCGVSLWACGHQVGYGGTAGVRIGTSKDAVSLPDGATIDPVMPGLGTGNPEWLESWSRSHHWFQRQDAMDVLISDAEASCKVVTADACLGLIGVVCSPETRDGPSPPSVDEFYLWRPTDSALAPDPL